MRFRVLGSARAVGPQGEVLDLGARKPRSVVAALALRVGRPVPADVLVDLVWGEDDAPRAAHGALHAYLSGLRKVLEPERAARGAASVIETTDHGYVLRAERGDVDAHAFVDAVREAERVLGPLLGQLEAAAPAGWPAPDVVAAQADALEATLSGWTGEPYADLPDHPEVLAARAGLEQARAAAEELRLVALLALGEHASVLATTESLTAQYPLRERLWALHALALVRGGRQADALAALRTAREVLAEELGLDPGSGLRTLEQAVLEQAPGLALPAEPGPATAVAVAAPSPVVTDRVELGRESERAALDALLGRPGFAAAQVIGEPGIGKSLLVDGLAARAAALGRRVATGRCSADDGAPPLWPWRAVLRDLDRTGDVTLPDDATALGAGFATWDAIATAVVAAAREHPVLLVLDDLHWADEASLRTLAHLLATAPDDVPLAVVATRRPHPEPTGRYAAAVEAFARRHALRLGLEGLPDAAADALLAHANPDAVGPDVLARWRGRAAGNPFFLIELARLGEGSDTGVPATVRDVVVRRLQELPEPVIDTLRTAAVTGRRARLTTVAAADGVDPDLVADRFDVAVAAGLVTETGVEEFTFAHALTQEAVVATLTGTQAARRHARVARALEGPAAAALDPAEVTAELARHWLAAGPSHAESAWRAARAAADQARRLTSYADAAALRHEAVEAHRRVAAPDLAERYELLRELATDAALAALWPRAERAAAEAMALGRSLGEPRLVAEAVRTLTAYSVWVPHDLDVVVEDSVEDLRWALDAAGQDHATRCVLQLGLAAELYYDEDARAENGALVEAGMTLARSVGDPALIAWAARVACIARYWPGATQARLAWAEEGLAAARRAQDETLVSLVLTVLGVLHLELGDRVRWERCIGEALEIADRLRLTYVLASLNLLQLSLAAMRGDDATAQAFHDRMQALVQEVELPMQELLGPAAELYLRLWDRDALAEITPFLVAVHAELHQGAVNVQQALARVGEVDALREHMRAFPIPHEPVEFWSTLSDWASVAESAAVAGDEAAAAHAVSVLGPYPGFMAMSGAASTIGPVAGYLALAHATIGDRTAASAHADAAERLAEEWGLTAYLAWLAERRTALDL